MLDEPGFDRDAYMGIPLHWRDAAREYHTARGANTLIVSPSGKLPVYRPEKPIAQGGRVPSDAELDAEYYRRIKQGEHIAASTLMAAEYLAGQGDARALAEWLRQRPEDERRAIVRHLSRRGRS
jgi:hypothetical protein